MLSYEKTHPTNKPNIACSKSTTAVKLALLFYQFKLKIICSLNKKKSIKPLKMESSEWFKYTFIPLDCLCFSLFFFPQSSTSVGIPTSGLNRNTSLGASSPKWQTLNASNSQKKYVNPYCGRFFQSKSYKIMTTKTSAVRRWKLILAIIIFFARKAWILYNLMLNANRWKWEATWFCLIWNTCLHLL